MPTSWAVEPVMRVLTAADNRNERANDPALAASLAHTLANDLGQNRRAWQVAVSVLESAGPKLDADELATVALGVSN